MGAKAQARREARRQARLERQRQRQAAKQGRVDSRQTTKQAAYKGGFQPGGALASFGEKALEVGGGLLSQKMGAGKANFGGTKENAQGGSNNNLLLIAGALAALPMLKKFMK